MTINTGISWTDHTINFWTGCKKVSKGCKYCYMYRDQERYGKDPSEVIQVKQSTINNHLKNAKPGDKIFTCSWSDFFIDEADEWRDWAWDIIRKHPQFIWQILTKRPERIKDCLPEDWGNGWSHVWLGTTIENHSNVCRVLSLVDHVNHEKKHKLFISAEPLIEWLDLADDSILVSACIEEFIDWIIVGGESGNENGKYKYRPCNLDWLQKVVEDATKMNIPVFVKQLGTHLAKTYKLKSRHGTDIQEFPKSLQIQLFPNV